MENLWRNERSDCVWQQDQDAVERGKHDVQRRNIAMFEKLIELYNDEQEMKRQEHAGKSWLWKLLHGQKKVQHPKVVRMLMRQRAKAVDVLTNDVAELLAANENAKADALLVAQVRKDYATRIENSAVRYISEAISADNEPEEEEGEQEEEEDEIEDTDAPPKKPKYSYNNVMARHIIGWFLITGYAFIFAFYVCLFGVAHGPTLTNAWLESFFLGFIQDTFILCPLKFFTFFYVLPKLTNNHLDLKRLKNVPSYAPSVIVAERFPQLQASNLILNRMNNPIVLQISLSDRMTRVVQYLLILVFGFILLLPIYAQDRMWDGLIGVAFNFLTLQILLAYLANPQRFFGASIVIFLCIVVYFNKKRLERLYARLKPALQVFNCKSTEDPDFATNFRQSC